VTIPTGIEVLRASFPADPAAGPALARLLLDQVARGTRGATLRISRPGPAVAFGRRDAVSPGYLAAASAAAALEHPGIERISGGRATAYTRGTLVIGFTIPSREPARGTTGRFEWVAGLTAEALRALGADAAVGEIEGEYCPGRYSVSIGGPEGRLKIAGLGQRMIPGAAHVGIVLTVSGSEELREVLTPVYRELGLDWRPETAGSVSDVIPGASVDDLERALVARLGRYSELREVELDRETETSALSAAVGFRSPRPGVSGRDPSH
jgi:octanoyl-[GcvH]:protein N-octanoyltransferase